MNWNDVSEPPKNIETVLVLLDDGSIKQAWWNSFEWKSQDEGFPPIEGTVIGWLSIDEYIQQSKALIDASLSFIFKGRFREKSE